MNMKKFILLFGCLIAGVSTYSQNAVMLLKGISESAPKTLCRAVNVPAAGYSIANQALLSHRPDKLSYVNVCFAVQLSAEKDLIAKSIASPTTLYGPYIYLRRIEDAGRDSELVNPAYATVWKHIHQTGYYNGAHHIINKSVIKRIHSGIKQNGEKLCLDCMQRDAPAIFHPMHGNPTYNNVFHNHEEQYEIYRASGVKALMQHQIKKINKLNRDIGLPEIEGEMYDGLMKEAELWCAIYGLKF